MSEDYPTSDEIRTTTLTAELEAEARKRRLFPLPTDKLVCALLNAYDAECTKPGSLNGYQRAAMETAVYPRTQGIPYTALKLAGEAGEVAQEVGKSIRDDAGKVTVDRRARLLLELGDVLWYVAALADELGFTLSEIAQMNLDKLRSRKARGTLQGSGETR